MVPSSLCEKGRHTAQSIPSATKRISEKRSRAGTVLALVRHTCTPLVPRAGVGWGGKQTKRVTRRADAKGGCPRSSKPSQVAPGADKPPLDAVARFAWHKGACPAPSVLFPTGSSRPTARRVRLDKWEKTGRIKAAVPHGSGRREVAPRRCQTKKH